MVYLRVAILGAGAIGSLIGAKLVQAGFDVLLHARGEHGAWLAASGLEVSGIEPAEITADQWTVTLDEIEIGDNLRQCCDLAIITSKANNTRELSHVAKYISKGAILTLQNGLGNLEILSSIVGAKRSFAGTTTHAVTRLGPGKIDWRHFGEIQLTSNNPFFEVFEKAKLNPKKYDDINSILWLKLLYNVAINPLSAIIGRPNGALLTEPLRSECLSIFFEAVQVARYEGIMLPENHELETNLLDLISNTSENICSMLQDVKRGNITEIEMLSGEVVRRGEIHGIPTPKNALLLTQVQALQI